MKRGAWNKFVRTREQYRVALEELHRSLPRLKKVQQKLVNARAAGNGAYTVETPIVYNSALDEIQSSDEIRLILVADNPGRREQAAENRRYLVGPSGKIAEKFFRDNPALGIDFRKNVIILNKTPIHTPRTAELRELCRLGGESLETALIESQRTMAGLLLEFHQALAPTEVWIIGYSEMRKGGIFESYMETLGELYRPRFSPKSGDRPAAHSTAKQNLCDQIFLYRHFSMNQFTIDLHQQAVAGKTLAENLECMGISYRRRILGW